MQIVQLCEIAMLVLFGCSWPFNIAKSVRSRTARGKSVMFECFILIGYLCGIIGKLVTYRTTGVFAYSFWFYIADMAMVAADLVLTIRNRALDRQAGQAS